MKDPRSSDGRTPRVWGALDVELPESVHERILAELPADCLGVEVHGPSSGNGGLTAYFESERQAREVARLLVRVLADSGVAGPPPRVRTVADDDWVERYQASLRPFDVGRRFTVDPSGGGVAAPGRVTIAMTPGRAFGTGEHPTTRLCVAALERHVARGQRWIDLGCGSGILAVVAARCGAGEVLALDIDPEAIGVAREVLRRNGVADCVRMCRGGVEAARPGCWDGVVVNISAGFLERAVATLRRLPRPGGVILASGFLEQERDDVRSTLSVASLVELSRETIDGWGLTVLGLPGGG